jgi:hypothetical protein
VGKCRVLETRHLRHPTDALTLLQPESPSAVSLTAAELRPSVVGSWKL